MHGVEVGLPPFMGEMSEGQRGRGACHSERSEESPRLNCDAYDVG